MKKLEDIANNELLTDMIGGEYHLTTNQGRGYGVTPLLVAQIYEGQISQALLDLLEDRMSFIDKNPSIGEFFVNVTCIQDIITEMENDNIHAAYIEEAKSLLEIMGKNYSYLHITKI